MYKEVFDNFNNLNFDFKVEINEDPIVNILLYFKIASYINMGNLNNRVKFDADAQYVFTHLSEPNKFVRKKFAQRADIMVSFFTPYKYAIKKEHSKTYHKTEADINILIEKAKSKEYEKVNTQFREFAEIYQDVGNIIILPDQSNLPKKCMNVNKFQCSEDKIDKALLECLDSGKLCEYFENDDAVISWIKEETLDCLLDENNSILPLTTTSLIKSYSQMRPEEIYQYITETVNLIKLRNKRLSNRFL